MTKPVKERPVLGSFTAQPLKKTALASGTALNLPLCQCGKYIAYCMKCNKNVAPALPPDEAAETEEVQHE